MRLQPALATIGLGIISAYVNAKAMEPVGMKLCEWESEADRRREDAVRPGPPYEIAAQKTAQLLGMDLSESQHQEVSSHG